MKKMNLFMCAILGVCTAAMTSCSNDAVSNEADGGMPATRSVAGAYKIMSMDVNVSGGTQQYTFAYNENNKLGSMSIVKYGTTTPVAIDYSVAGKIIMRCDPGVGELMRYTYTLNSNGHVASAEEAYDSDGYLVTQMQFTYDASKRLTAIQLKEDDGSYTDLSKFTYVGRNNHYATITEEGILVTPTFNIDWLNKGSFDLNLLCLFGVGSAYGDLFTYAVFADLFPNPTSLLYKITVNANNKVDYAFTMNVDKAMACAITSTSEETDEDTGETAIITSTTNVTFGY